MGEFEATGVDAYHTLLAICLPKSESVEKGRGKGEGVGGKGREWNTLLPCLDLMWY